MRTQEVIEGLLYITNHRDILTKCLTACHILNDEDRNWESIQHTEFYFLDTFKYCDFLEVIDKQVHVFLIGDKVKGRSYNILQIEGFSCELLTLSKTELITYIKDLCKEVSEMYLPDMFGQRIIYIKPDYINGLLGDDNIYVFNRQSLDSGFFKKSKWTIGTDIYSVNQREYQTKADSILKEILGEVV